MRPCVSYLLGAPETSWSWGGAWSLWELPGSLWDARGEEYVNDVLVNEETCHFVKGGKKEKLVLGVRACDSCSWEVEAGGFQVED